MGEAAEKLCIAIAGSLSREANDLSDEELALLAQSGDEAAFEQIFIRHRLRVARIAGRFFNRAEKVEEVAQDVFAKAWFALDDYSRERGPSFAAWLSRIAINSCYDQLRRARRRPENSFSSISQDEALFLNSHLRDEKAADAETDVISRDLAEKLLARLGADDRLILTLLDGQEMSVAEIAETLGWGVSKVKVRAHRARAALRRVIGEFI
jgi:RNA polymerase sigma-70 factor (ECF subfamily)